MLITGVRYQGGAKELLLKSHKDGKYIFLEKEMFNMYDPNAIKAFAMDSYGTLQPIGHVSKPQAAQIVKMVKSGTLDFEINDKDKTCENFYIACKIESVLNASSAPVAEAKVIGLLTKVEVMAKSKTLRNKEV